MTDEPRAETVQAAIERHDWRQAYETLSAADQRGELSANELGVLAQAAWWLGMLAVAIEARERAYAAASRPAISSPRCPLPSSSGETTCSATP